MNNPVVIVDADAIVAQAYPDDSNHKLATTVSGTLNDLNAQVIYPVTAILEATTVLQGRLNSGATAYGTSVTFTDPNIQIAEINQETQNQFVKNQKVGLGKSYKMCLVSRVCWKAKPKRVIVP